MPKRKASSRKKQDSAGGAKKTRTQGAAAAAADATDSDSAFEAALTRANLAPLIAEQTLKLMDAIKATDISRAQCVQVVVDLLKADADRPDSLLDLSLPLEGHWVSPLHPHTASASAFVLESH